MRNTLQPSRLTHDDNLWGITNTTRRAETQGDAAFIDALQRHHKEKRGGQMLILSRKENQSIVINDNIKITVIEIRDNVIALGIKAPKEIGVHRKEIYEAIKAGEPPPPKADKS